MGRDRQEDGSASSGYNSELFSSEIFNGHLPRYSLHEATGINPKIIRIASSRHLDFSSFTWMQEGFRNGSPHPHLVIEERVWKWGLFPRQFIPGLALWLCLPMACADSSPKAPWMPGTNHPLCVLATLLSQKAALTVFLHRYYVVTGPLPWVLRAFSLLYLEVHYFFRKPRGKKLKSQGLQKFTTTLEYMFQ